MRKIYLVTSSGKDLLRNFRFAPIIITSLFFISNVNATTITIAITNGTNPTCAGSSVTFTATAVGGNKPFTYQWNKNGTLISGQTTTTYTTTTLINGDQITCTQTSNASQNTIVTSSPITMVVSNSATTGLTYSINSPIYCVGSSITPNSPSYSGGAPISFSISSLPAGLSINTSTGIITGVPTTATASANYTVTASNGCGSIVKMLNITISNPPSTAAAPPSQSACSNTTQNFTFNNVISGSGGDQIEYATNSSFTGSIIAASPATISINNVASGTTTTIFIRSTNSTTGCVSSTVTTTATVVTQPVADNITPNVAAGNICAGQSLSATFSGASGGAGTVTDVHEYSTDGGTSYIIYTGSINTSTLAGQTVIIRTSRTATGTGCAVSTFKTVTWSVVAQPVADDIAPNVAAGNVCAGQSLSATFNGASGGGGTVTDVHEYSINGGGTYSNYTAALNTAALAGQTVIIRSSRTATGPGCTTSAFKTITWTVVAAPVADNITPNVAAGSVCAGQSLSATFSGASGGAGTITDVHEYSIDGGTSYSPYAGAISTSGLAGQTVIIRTSRTATGTGCTTSAFKIVTWTVVAQPVADDITPNVAPGNVCAGQSLSATFTGASGGGGTVTDVHEYSINGGASYSSYTSSINTSTLAGQTVIIRTSRTATGSGCTTSAFKTVTWTVVAAPVADDITPNVAAGSVCTGQSLSATFSGASGGSGTITDVHEFSIDGGTSYNPYTTAINTSSLTGQTVIIRSSRTATGSSCTTSAFKTVTWTVVAQPVADDITPNVAPGNICTGQSLSATFAGASGGGGTVTDVHEYSINGGTSYSPYTAAINTSALAGQTVIIRSSRTATGSGCTTSAFKTVTWTVIAQPVADNITPNVAAGSVCDGQSLSALFSGASGGAGTITDLHEYSINGGTSYSPYAGAISTSGLAGQTVIIRSSRTATATGCTTSAFKTVTWTVVAQPVADDITPNVAPGNVCAGQSLSATFGGALGGSGTITDVHQYSINGGASYSNYISPINTSGLGGQTVIIRTSRTATGSGCTTSAFKTITWSVVAQPSLTAPSPASQTACTNGTIGAISITASGGSGTFSYQWYSNATNSTTGGTNLGSANGAQTPSYLPSSATAGTKYYYVVVTQTGAGCGPVTSATTAGVTVLAQPILTAPSPASQTVCSNGTIGAINVTASGGTGTFSYQWFSNTTNSTTGGTNLGSGSGAQTASYTPPANSTSGTTYYYVVLTQTGAGCGPVTSATTANVMVAAQPTLTAPSPATQSVCISGTSGAISVIASGGTGTFSYQWFSNTTNSTTGGTNLGSASGAQTPSYTPPSATAGTKYYYVVVTQTGAGCGPVTSATTASVTVSPGITAGTSDWTAVPTCSGSGIQLQQNGTPTGGNGTFTYQWNESIGNCGSPHFAPGVSDQPTYIVPAGSEGNCYTLTIFSGGCSYTYATKGKANALPITGSRNIDFGTSATTICRGTSTTLTASSTVSYTYAWSPATGLSTTTGATVTVNPTLDPAYSTTMYTVTGTATSGPACTHTANVTVTVNPLATLSGVSASTVCSGSNATVTLSGLLSNSTSSITYNVGGGSPQTATGVVASGTTGTFTLPVTYANNGQVLTVTSISSSISSGPACAQTFTTNNTVTLIVNAPLSITTQPTGTTFCSGINATFNIAVAGTGTIYQWQVSTDGGSTFANISDGTAYAGTATNVLTVKAPTIAMHGYQYKVKLTSAAPCNSNITSNAATLLLANYWTGTLDNNWNNAGNWTGSSIPDISLSCGDVYIPSGSSFQPTLSSAAPAIHDLKIASGRSLTLNTNLQIAGTITNSGTFNVTNGGIELNGSSVAQNIAGSMFSTRTIKDLKISNAAGVNVSAAANDTLNITGTLSFGVTSSTLNTGDNITLKSLAAGTANVGQLATGNIISGKVIVERFISAKRAWRYLSVPTSATGQSIKSAWQEGAMSSGSNPAPHYGTQVTDSTSAWAANGFDYYSPEGPSVKKFNTVANSGYVGITNTSVPIATTEGLMTFVRGDRTAIGLYATPTTTVLRTKGTLFTGDQNYPVTAGKYNSIGNPYAAPLDMRLIAKTAGVDDQFYVYDPLVNTFGIFQTFTKIGSDYYATPGNGSYPVPATPYNFIASGNAFLVTATTSGSMTIKENAKATGDRPLVFRPVPETPPTLLRTTLYILGSNSNAILVDGTLNLFSDNYSNAVDGSDAGKVRNFYENLAIKNDTFLLAVERRHSVIHTDTIHLNIQKMKEASYQFKFTGQSFNPSLGAFLEDSSTHARIPLKLNGTTGYTFNITPGSADNPSRFRIVFTDAAGGPLPLTFTTVKAYEQNRDIAVEWKVQNETNIKEYEIEKSADGQHFTAATTVSAKLNNNSSVDYQWLDVNVFPENNYYRVKSVDINGNIRYSNIIKIIIGGSRSAVLVYPNPVNEGNINLQLINQPKGRYGLRLLNKAGQVIMVKEIEHQQGSSTESLRIRLLAHEAYQLEVTRPDRSKTNINILY